MCGGLWNGRRLFLRSKSSLGSRDSQSFSIGGSAVDGASNCHWLFRTGEFGHQPRRPLNVAPLKLQPERETILELADKGPGKAVNNIDQNFGCISISHAISSDVIHKGDTSDPFQSASSRSVAY
jgi:hypothetical protein